MPARRLLALYFALALPTAPAVAQSVPLPHEAQIGPRPFYLVDKMKEGPLKQKLSQCTGPFHKTDFSIGHRGAALMFPEHSKEAYTPQPHGRRHHRMRRDIHEGPPAGLSAFAMRFTPRPTSSLFLRWPRNARRVSAGRSATGRGVRKVLHQRLYAGEFKQLTAKMDSANTDATTVADYINGTPRWRTDLYANRAR
jgi:glycerophosphoryl diester phosphodiesterase